MHSSAPPYILNTYNVYHRKHTPYNTQSNPIIISNPKPNPTKNQIQNLYIVSVCVPLYFHAFCIYFLYFIFIRVDSVVVAIASPFIFLLVQVSLQNRWSLLLLLLILLHLLNSQFCCCFSLLLCECYGVKPNRRSNFGLNNINPITLLLSIFQIMSSKYQQQQQQNKFR